jgi:hypothetical protein
LLSFLIGHGGRTRGQTEIDDTHTHTYLGRYSSKYVVTRGCMYTGMHPALMPLISRTVQPPEVPCGARQKLACAMSMVVTPCNASVIFA